MRSILVGRVLALVILLTALAFGGVHGWASALAEIAVALLGLSWFIAGRPADPLPRAVVVSIVALYGYLALQLVPVPSGLLEIASPRTADLYRETSSALERIGPAQKEIASIGPYEDGKLSVVERERIRAFARERWSALPQDWRPIAIYPFASRSDLLVYVACGIVLWLAATVSAPRRCLRSLFFSGVALALLAIVQFATWNGHILWFFDSYDQGPWLGEARMMGSFVNPDHFADFLVMLLGPGGALLLESLEANRRSRGSRRHRSQAVARVIVALGLAVLVAAIIGTASRGGILAAALSGAVLYWGSKGRVRADEAVHHASARRARSNRALRLRAIARRYAPALIVLGILVGGYQYAGERARGVFDARVGQTSRAEAGFRLLMPIQTLPMIRDFPLFGVGAGCWNEVFRRYERYPMVAHTPNHAHNDYVEWCAEVGLVGVVLTLFGAASLADTLRRNPSLPPVLRAGIFASLGAAGFHAALDFGLRIPANALLLSALVGLACNRGWAQSQGPIESSRPSLPARAAAVAGAAILVAASLRQFQEFRQWQSVRAGSPILRFAPEDAETWYALGARLYGLGFRYHAPTEECFRAALERRPAMPAPAWRLSLVAEPLTSKLDYLELALRLDPTRSAGRIERAKLLDLLGRQGEVLGEVEEAVYRDPVLSRHAYLQEWNRGLSEPVLEAAKRGFRRALAERPRDEALLNDAATFYRRFRIWDDAASLWLRAAEATSEPAPYLRGAGESYASGGDYLRAESILRQAVEEDPREPEGYRLLALSVYRPEGNYDRAREILEVGIHRSREAAPLYVARYELEREAGRSQAALEALARAAELRRRDAALQFQLGAAYSGAEDYHRAKIAFDRAIAINPRYAPYHYYRGVACERLYDLAGALESYKKALQLAPENADYARSVESIERAFAERGS